MESPATEQFCRDNEVLGKIQVASTHRCWQRRCDRRDLVLERLRALEATTHGPQTVNPRSDAPILLHSLWARRRQEETHNEIIVVVLLGMKASCLHQFTRSALVRIENCCLLTHGVWAIGNGYGNKRIDEDARCCAIPQRSWWRPDSATAPVGFGILPPNQQHRSYWAIWEVAPNRIPYWATVACQLGRCTNWAVGWNQLGPSPKVD
jgi:hypothetical protein